MGAMDGAGREFGCAEFSVGSCQWKSLNCWSGKLFFAAHKSYNQPNQSIIKCYVWTNELCPFGQNVNRNIERTNARTKKNCVHINIVIIFSSSFPQIFLVNLVCRSRSLSLGIAPTTELRNVTWMWTTTIIGNYIFFPLKWDPTQTMLFNHTIPCRTNKINVIIKQYIFVATFRSLIRSLSRTGARCDDYESTRLPHSFQLIHIDVTSLCSGARYVLLFN